jgi:hypothetical protein
MSELHPSVYVPATGAVETRVSSYDKLNAILLSLLILVGLFVTMLFFMWLTSNYKPPTVVTEENFLIGDPGEEKPEGVADDVLEPGVEEFPEVETPQLADALLAVTNSVSTILARNEMRDGNAAQMGRGRGLGSRDGGGSGGHGRPVWNVEFEAKDRNSYYQQLSFFKIEIGAIHKLNNNVYRLSDPAGAAAIRATDRSAEKANRTVLFSHRIRRLEDWDKDLLRKADLRNLDDYVLGQVYPQAMINQLRAVETEYAKSKGHEIAEVRATTFKVVPGGPGYQLEVTEQTYRR